MHEKQDFQSMTLDALTPIVSMRPGKEYTKEELRIARTVFMEKLGCLNPEIEPEEAEETEAVPSPIEVYEALTLEDALPIDSPSPILHEVPVEAEGLSSVTAIPVFDETVAPKEIEEVPHVTEASPVAATPEAVHEENVFEEPEAVSTPLETEEFILKADSRLARFLYRLYAYFLLPLLALESLAFLLASVGTAVAIADAPYIIIHVICAAVYTMIISLAWHQFFHRTKFGLLLNRSILGVCIIRGFLMLLAGTDIVWGVIFVALSVLFLVYFIGYDNMFIIPSPKRQRVQ